MGQTMPSATNDLYSVNEDSNLSVNSQQGVLKNDSDVGGNAITAIMVGGASFGILTLNPDGSFTYTPLQNFNGVDTFSYVANNSILNSTQATVNITVNPLNDIPVARNDSYFVNEDNTLTIVNPGILLNDTDSDGNALVASIVTNVNHGTLTLNPNGSFNYKPVSNFNGMDSFTYDANDGSTNSNAATVTIKINPVNTLPTDDVLDKLLDQIQSLLNKITGLEKDVTSLKEKNNVLESRVLLLESVIDGTQNNHGDDDNDEEDDNDDDDHSKGNNQGHDGENNNDHSNGNNEGHDGEDD